LNDDDNDTTNPLDDREDDDLGSRAEPAPAAPVGVEEDEDDIDRALPAPDRLAMSVNTSPSPEAVSEVETPDGLGFRMPAEWGPHAATWLAWPHERSDWPGRFGPIEWVYVDLIRQITPCETVVLVVPGEKIEDRARTKLERAGVDLDRVKFFRAKTDRSWLRDTMPSFLVHDSAPSPADRAAVVHWKFNAWAKYDNYDDDAKLGRVVARALQLRRFVPRAGHDGQPRRVVLEGGAIDTNGAGTLLVTEECLLSPVQERNPGFDREAYEQVLGALLGARQIIWLGRGIAGDDTHGHVDDVARFVGPNTVVCCEQTDPSDPDHEPLRDNLRRLRAATDQDGRRLDVVPLPMPRPIVFEGQRLPASYANFIFVNGRVLVPTFNDPADRVALHVFEGLFPDRSVVGIHALDLVWGLGTLHCASREQPSDR
jgi:agmatine deiminase